MTHPDIHSKQPDLQAIAQTALVDESYRKQLFELLLPGSKRAQARYNSYRSLILLSESNPELLMPLWGPLVGMLSSSNKDIIFIAVNLLANLASADQQNCFEEIFDTFFNLIGDQSIVVAMHTAGAAGKIAQAQPHLREQITRRLLGIEEVRGSLENSELVKAYAISAFDAFFEESTEQEDILRFVRQQLTSTSPKTRKAAKEFLKKHAQG
jgi:hypothetical protein